MRITFYFAAERSGSAKERTWRSHTLKSLGIALKSPLMIRVLPCGGFVTERPTRKGSPKKYYGWRFLHCI